jgi:hypothetical protein
MPWGELSFHVKHGTSQASRVGGYIHIQFKDHHEDYRSNEEGEGEQGKGN